MSEVQETSLSAQPCPICGVLAEPEVEGDLRWWECESDECESGGHQWGWERWLQPRDDSCSLGIPEDVRRAASRPMEQAQAAERQSQPVMLGDIGFGPPGGV